MMAKLKISEVIPDKEDRDRLKAVLEIFNGEIISIKDKKHEYRVDKNKIS